MEVLQDGKWIHTTNSFQLNIRDETGKSLLKNSLHNSPIASYALSPNKKFIVTGSENLVIKLWEKESRRCIASIINGHDSS